ncbi:CU044_5270 family protein [Actinoplanes sp. GCM10030250]|uniref:CU044_5270 family protein n=1 Tax=Actinoplanes sp. GCM10030250 TaxID=3273376 RepID=UPI003670FB1C
MTDEIDVAVQELYPVPPRDPVRDPEALRRVRARVLREVVGDNGLVAGGGGRRKLLAAAAVFALAASGAVLVARDTAERDTSDRTAMVEVAQTLSTAADAQIRTVDEPVPPGKYRYIATHAVNVGLAPPAAVLFGTRDEMWVPADPAGVWFQLRTDTGERTRLSGTDRQVEDAGLETVRSQPERLSGACGEFHPGQGGRCGAQGNWQQPTGMFVAALPRDPGALFERLRADTEGHGQDPDQEVLVYAADALRSGMLPAVVRAALYRALAYLPTLEITERRATLDGHTGTALGISAAGQRKEIVVDPVTGSFVGERTRLTEAMDGMAAGTVIGSSTVRYAVVDHPWERPAR